MASCPEGTVDEAAVDTYQQNRPDNSGAQSATKFTPSVVHSCAFVSFAVINLRDREVDDLSYEQAEQRSHALVHVSHVYGAKRPIVVRVAVFLFRSHPRGAS